jgi:hypothetical protein
MKAKVNAIIFILWAITFVITAIKLTELKTKVQELTTVNQELVVTIDELRHAHADLITRDNNLFNSCMRMITALTR